MLNKLLGELCKELAGEHGIQSELLLANSVVCNAVVRPIVGSNFFAQISAAHLLPALGLFVCKVCRMKLRIKLFPERFDGHDFVLSLVALVLILTHYSCGDVRGSHRRVGCVHVLATRTLRSVSVDADVLHIKLKVTRHNRHHNDYGSAGVKSAGLLGLGHALHLVDSTLVLQVFVDVVSFYAEGAGLAPSACCRVHLKTFLLHAKAHQAAIVLVHLNQVTCKQTGLRAACSRLNLKSAIARVRI